LADPARQQPKPVKQAAWSGKLRNRARKSIEQLSSLSFHKYL
jgi:hypothetical protein